MPVSEQTQLDWLRLIRSENVGPITFYKLLEFYGDAGRALKALPEMARRGGRKKPLKACSENEALSEYKALKKMGAEIIIHCDPRYPAHLRACEDAPPVLSVLGNISLMQKQGLGIVGARNASITGKKLAERFASDIGSAGFPIISGLARGIDTAAHKSSLQYGTIAVIAGGLDIPYPSENEQLYNEIAKYGAIIAESPLGTAPQARHFPKRNRIIAGLSYGVLVVEAAQKSGSLITAHMAMDYGRDLYAIPGSPLDPRASGANSLLKANSAQLVTSPEDILNDLRQQNLTPLRETSNDQSINGSPRPIAESAARADEQTRKECRNAILNALSTVPVHLDDVIRDTQSPPALVMAIILELELADHILRSSGNKISLISDVNLQELA